MADLTKYSKGKRMVFEQDIKQIAENTKEIVDLKEDLQGKVNSYVVTNIKALTSDFINKLKSGDVVVKQTGSGQHPQYHSYRVSFMKDNEGMCLTYTDASCSETVSYDKSGNNWVYNSTDLTQFDKIVEVIEPQGTEEQAQGLKINGVDYKLGGGDEVHLYEHHLLLSADASDSTRISFYYISQNPNTITTLAELKADMKFAKTYIGAYIDKTPTSSSSCKLVRISNNQTQDKVLFDRGQGFNVNDFIRNVVEDSINTLI